MNTPNAKTIQIFLPTGEPRGIRVAELTTRIVQAVAIPRSDLATAKARAELDHVAVYFLFGESEGAAKPIVYIGQTEDVRKRLDHSRCRSARLFYEDSANEPALLLLARIRAERKEHENPKIETPPASKHAMSGRSH